MTTKPKKPEPLPDPYVSAVGPVPPEHFDDDQRCLDDDEIDTSKGSVYGALSQRGKPAAKP